MVSPTSASGVPSKLRAGKVPSGVEAVGSSRSTSVEAPVARTRRRPSAESASTSCAVASTRWATPSISTSAGPSARRTITGLPAAGSECTVSPSARGSSATWARSASGSTRVAITAGTVRASATTSAVPAASSAVVRSIPPARSGAVRSWLTVALRSPRGAVVAAGGLLPQGVEVAGVQGVADAVHQAHHEPLVVDRAQGRGDHLLGPEQMVHVGGGVVGAGVAVAVLVDGRELAAVPGSGEVHAAGAGVDRAVARHSGGGDAVEGVGTGGDRDEQV